MAWAILPAPRNAIDDIEIVVSYLTVVVRGPNIAVPILSHVAPSLMAMGKSLVIKMIDDLCFVAQI